MRLIAAIAALLLVASCVADGEGEERFPTSEDYPPGVMSRIDLPDAGGSGWRLSALTTPTRAGDWKIVVVTGTPSWSEYWAPTIAAAPADVTMIVADRPGFAKSEPRQAVTDITAQANALAAMLDGPEGQKVVLVGQSFGGPISALLAAARPDKVRALVLMSAYFGDRGATARRLYGLGGVARPLLPRDLKNAVAEVGAQPPQLAAANAALERLTIPIIVLHGDEDSFVPVDAARSLAGRLGPRAELVIVEDGDHFLNACCVKDVIAAAERGIALAEAR
jgi:pimeloyl-ACP methyl ester carboxylesterase